MKLLIGSRALAYWNKDFQLKPNADWDIISDEPIEGATYECFYEVQAVERLVTFYERKKESLT